jgi:hypothetical protein
MRTSETLTEVAKETTVLGNKTSMVGKIAIDVSEERDACIFNVEE